MAQFVDVTVTYKDGQVKVDTDPVGLRYNHPEGPDSVRWILDTALTSETLEITWKSQNPFDSMQTKSGGHVVEGTENKKVPGDYDYTVTVRVNGAPAGQRDGRVRNNP